MKSSPFNHTLLAVGVAAAMGLSTTATATTRSEAVSNGAAPIENIATAVYKVGDVDQPEVKSNKVTVNISETAQFSLVAVDGSDKLDNKNEDIPATPNTNTRFNNILTNIGNVTDTYTIEITDKDSSIVTKDPNYYLRPPTDITFTIQPIGGGTLTNEQVKALEALKQSQSGTIKNGGTIQLPPGLEAALSYDLATGDQLGGNIGVGTLTATSTFISGVKGETEAKLINENQTIVTVPVFKIEKSATCQSKADCNSLDLNAANTDIDYSIKVTNVTTEYSVAADNFVIRDVLPKGMTLKGNVTLPSGAKVVTTGTDTDGRQIIDVTVPSLEVGADLTVSFKVEIDVPTLRAAGNATNHATIYDNYDDTTPNPDDKNNGFDISDSTDDTTDNPNVPQETDGSETDGKDTTPTITFTDRDISITDANNQEVAVKGKVTYNHTITNNGNEDEGGADRKIVIAITDPNTENALSIDKTTGNEPYYSTDGGATKKPLVDNKDGTYRLPDDIILVPNTSTDPDNPTPGSSVDIGYTVVSDGENEDIDVTKETNKITVKPGGDFAPTLEPITNETTIRGLKLKKLAAVVSAKGNQSLSCPAEDKLNTLSFSDGTTGIKAEPFDCIVYKITATNTFTTKDLTNVTVSDKKSQWESQSTYQGDLKGLINGSTNNVKDNDIGEALTSEFSTLPSKTDGTMTFSIKVNP